MTALSAINGFLLKVAQRAEVLGAVVVMAIVFIFIVPLPTWLVDILIALNICISCLLIVLALYLPGPLAFSSFPSILLLTTMFRLSLSIATTRLILLEQDAGHIVEAFGNFVVGGNLAVGMVIFLILTLVNFLVITKGSERVAEVAARFSLDAMPGRGVGCARAEVKRWISADGAGEYSTDLCALPVSSCSAEKTVLICMPDLLHQGLRRATLGKCRRCRKLPRLIASGKLAILNGSCQQQPSSRLATWRLETTLRSFCCLL